MDQNFQEIDGRAIEKAARQRILRRLVLALMALIALLIIGASGYAILEDMNPIDALYMTIITISTVGFGEVEPLSQAGKLYTLGIIIAGGSLAAYAFGGVVEFLISGDWRSYLEERRLMRTLDELNNHIIVCGYGRMGRHVVSELIAEGLDFVVIDQDTDKVDKITENGYPALLGNAANEDYLREAGIERAKGLVAAVNSDAENVFITLTARGMRDDLTIVSRANFEESEGKLKRAGADRVLMPYGITGRRMVTLLVRPDVADFLDEVSQAGGLELLLEQVQISPTSSLAGQTLEEVQLGNRFGVTVLACKMPDGRLLTRPGADTMIDPEVQIIVLGTRQSLQKFIELADQ